MSGGIALGTAYLRESKSKDSSRERELKLDWRMVSYNSCQMFLAARRATLLLAIVAMVFKGLLPTGWMPNPSGFGETAFILCDMDMSTQDMAAMMAANPDMDMSAMHMAGDDGKKAPHAHSECPFAAASHAGAAMAGTVFALPTRAAAYAEAPRPERSAAILARYQPQSPRAPPTICV